MSRIQHERVGKQKLYAEEANNSILNPNREEIHVDAILEYVFGDERADAVAPY